MDPLYTLSEVRSLTRRKNRCRLWALILSVLTAAVCITLCFFVRTGNAGKLQLLVTVVFMLGGWAVILLLRAGYFPAKALKAHCEGMLSGVPDEYRGILTVTGQAIRIPKSVVARRVTLRDGEEEIALSVEDGRAAVLPVTDGPVRVAVVRKFITSVEVLREET